MVGGALVAAAVFLGALSAGEEELEVLFGEGHDVGFFGFGAGDVVDDMAVDEALSQGPGPEGGEAGVIVEEGFGGEVVEAGEERLEVAGGDGGQGGAAAEIALEGAVGGLIVGQGMGGESPGAGGDEVAVDGVGKGNLVIHEVSGPLLPGRIMVGRTVNGGSRFF